MAKAINPKIMKEKIRLFPVTMFAIIMGLSGLSIVSSKFHQLEWLPHWTFHAMLFFTSIVFVIVFTMYLLKSLLFFGEVKKEFRHRIKINFFSAISISFILLGIVYRDFNFPASKVLWSIGTAAHTYLMLHTIAFWIQHNLEIKFMNPAWFIPVVGNILVPVAGMDYMPREFSTIYFAIGFFFWIILFTIFLNRVIFHDQMAQRFMPTLFILIAPPAVGFLAYLRISDSYDLFAEFMLYLGYFFLVLLLFLYKSFAKLKFFISWWAFTFPLTAITVASAVGFERTGYAIYQYLAYVLGVIAAGVIIMVSIITIRKIIKGEICVEEE